MKKGMAVILAAVTALSLTACGGSGTAGNTQNDTQSQSSETGAGASSSGNTDMVVAMGADIDTLHPSDYSTTAELTVLNQLYDTMMYMNPDGEHDPEAASRGIIRGERGWKDLHLPSAGGRHLPRRHAGYGKGCGIFPESV